MSFIKKILENLRPESKEDGDQKKEKKGKSRITNKILYKELIEHFETELEELSVGRRILYPMSFNILLHPDDYERVGESLPFILPEVIAGFYAIIKAKSKLIPDSKSTNPAKYWFFQFASSKVKTNNDEESFIVPGEIVTVGHLTTFDIKKAQQGTSSENMKLSVKCKNSNVNQNNINQEALLGMDILTNNAYIFKYDEKMSQELSDIQANQRGGNNALATLTYSDGPHYIDLAMLDELVIISGSKETRDMENILIVKSDNVDVGHVQIRYLKERNRFQLCAYSNTRLNTRNIPLSVGGDPIWRDMSFESDIFLNESVNIHFKASESIKSKG